MDSQQLALIIAAYDRASPVLRAIGSRLDELTAHARQMQRTFQGQQALQGLHALRGAFGALSGAAGSALSGIMGLFRSLVGAAVDLAGRIAGTLVSAFQAAAGAAVAAGAAIGGVLAAGFAAVGKAGVDMNVSLQTAQRGLTAITGSASGAAQLIQGMKREAILSNLTFKEMLPLGQQLAAVYGPQGLGKVLPTLRAFGDAGSLLAGGDPEAVGRALRQFRQVASGIVDRESLRTIEENLPGSGVMDIIRRQFGTVDTETLNAAGVTGAMLADAIVAGFQQKFGGAQARAAGSIPQALSGISDAFNEFAGNVTSRFAPQVAGALTGFLQTLQSLAGNERLISALSVPFELVGKAIEAAAAQLPRFAEWLTQILTRQNVINFLAQIAGWVETLGAKVMEFVNAATGGGGLVAVWDAFRQAAFTALDFVVRSWNGFVALVEYFAANSGQVWKLIQDGIDTVRVALETATGAVTLLVAAMVGAEMVKALANLAEMATLLGRIRGGGGGVPGGGVPKAPGAAVGVGLLPPTIAIGTVAMQAEGAREVAGNYHGLTRDLAALRARRDLSVAEKRALARERARQEYEGPAPPVMGFFRDRLKDVGLLPRHLPAMTAQDRATLEHLQQRLGGGPGATSKSGARSAANPLQQLGQGVLGLVGGAGNAALQAVPPQLRQFFSGGQAAFQRGFSRGLPDLAAEANQRATRHAGTINRLLGPGGAGSPAIAPGHQMFGGGTAAAAPRQLTDKEFDAVIAARSSYFNALKEQAKVAADAAPEAQQALAEAQRLIPILQQQVEGVIIPQLRRYQQGTKEYFEAWRDYWQIQGSIGELQRRAGKEQLDAAKKAAQETKQVSEARLGLLEAQLKNNPFLTDRQRQQALVPGLVQQFQQSRQPVAGESELESLQRQTEGQGLLGRIQEAFGLNDKRLRVFGGGEISGVDRRQYAALQSMLGNAPAAPAGSGAPKFLQFVIYPNSGQSIEQQVLAILRQQSLQVDAGPNY